MNDGGVTSSHDPSAIADAVNAFFAEYDVASLRLPSAWFGRPHDNWHQLSGAVTDGDDVLVRLDDTQVLTLDAEGASTDGRVLGVAVRSGRWHWTEYGGHNEHDEVLGPGVVAFPRTVPSLSQCAHVETTERIAALSGHPMRLGSGTSADARLTCVELGPGRPEHRSALETFLQNRNTLRVARRGVLVDALDHPTVLAWSHGELTGAATYVVDGDGCEILTLHAATRLRGVGTALLSAVKDMARDAGCRRLCVVTTNDNVDALRFYQRRGFRLVLIRPGAVDRSRETLKPEIPTLGAHDIPLRDELELEMTLSQE